MKDYYVYVYLDPRKPGNYVYGDYSFEFEPYYIGKGKNTRITDEHNQNGIIWMEMKIVNEGLKPIRNMLNENLEEHNAYELETHLIKTIGRRFEGGPLINITKDQSKGFKKSRKKREAKKKKLYKASKKAQNEMESFLNSLK